MPDYKQEQLLVVLTTTFSLLTAWSWNSVLQQYISEYYDNSLSTHVLSAVIVSIITFLLIDWLLKHMDIRKKELDAVQNSDLTGYVIKGLKPYERSI